MDWQDWFVFFILSFSIAEFSIQVVISELSDWIKGVLRLRLPYNGSLSAIGNFGFWYKLGGFWWLVAATPVILILNLHKFLANLLACAYCTSFWLMLSVNLLHLHMNITEALLLTPVALIAVAVLDRIHTR